MIIKKRCLIRFLSFFTIAFLILIVSSVTKNSEAKKAGFTLSMAYRRSIAELAETADNLNIALQKSSYAGTPYQTIGLATEIWEQSSKAKAAFEQLPITDVRFEKTSKVLTQAGDYSYVISKKILSEGKITEEEKENLKKLSTAVQKICISILHLSEVVTSENSDYEQIALMLKHAEENAEELSLNPIEKIEESIETVPTLIYDGPFSDGMHSSPSNFLAEKDPITVERGQQIAAYIMDVKQRNPILISDINTKNTKCFYYNYKNYDIYITKMGGYLHSLSKNRAVADASLSDEECVAEAKAFLKKFGYKGMIETYSYESSNILTINFAYKQDEIVCYPDLIKVGVALDNGEVVFFDASEYLNNHEDARAFNKKISLSDAKAKINSDYEPKHHRETVIPTDGGNENCCYEFLLEDELGKKALVYINIETGREEKILILLQTDNGILTM